MNKDICFRVIRIFVVSLFLLITYILRDDLDKAYALSNNFLSSYSNKVSLVELSDGINLVDALPVLDEVGKNYNGFTFKVVNNLENEQLVKIYFNNTYEVVDDRLSHSNIRYVVYKNGEVFKDCSNLSEDGFLFEDVVRNSNVYELKIWISYDSGFEILDKKFVGKITLL